MKTPHILFALIVIISSFACQKKSPNLTIAVTNPIDISRQNETVEISLSSLPEIFQKTAQHKLAIKSQNGKTLVSQLVDMDGDKTNDLIIFQSDFKPNETIDFTLTLLNENESQPESDHTTYSRFVPERTDDFAWENDRVAFRAYGPNAQQLAEAGDPKGTLSSGIDCWLKRVDYPIIDKWYKQDLEQHLSYHKDHGEGLDSYHVGASRGVGGIGIWDGESLLTSKNYQSWKILANGPIRTIFELDYGQWQAGEWLVKEKKHISIDLGKNLFKCSLVGPDFGQLPNITVGITLHDKTGTTKFDKESGWLRYREPMSGADLTTAVVIDPSQITNIEDHRVDEPDQSHLMAICKPKDSFTYYAGFYWSKSNQFESSDAFDNYLPDFSKCVLHPLQVAILE